MSRQELLHDMAMVMFNKPYVLLTSDEQAEVEAECNYLDMGEKQEYNPINNWQEILFEQMLKPENLIKQFETMEEFKAWMETGRLEDLEEQLQDFVRVGYYDHACIIRDEIYKRKINNTLSQCEINLID